MTDSANLPLIDREAALERVGGDESLLTEIAALFLDEYPGILDTVRSAVREADARALERSAHNLKGAVANFGAEPVVDAALTLEKMGRGADLRGSAEALDRLERGLVLLHEELRRISLQ